MTLGRPMKLDQVLRRNERGEPVTIAEHVVQAIQAGNYIEQAAASAGVDRATIQRWQKTGARIAAEIEQGRRTVPRAGSKDRQQLDFCGAVAEAEALWEVQANAQLERLSRPRPIEETRVTTEAGPDGTVVTKTVKVSKTAEADSATIRWRLAHRFPNRYGDQVDVTGVIGVGPMPESVRERAEQALGASVDRLVANITAKVEAAEAEPEPQT